MGSITSASLSAATAALHRAPARNLLQPRRSRKPRNPRGISWVLHILGAAHPFHDLGGNKQALIRHSPTTSGRLPPHPPVTASTQPKAAVGHSPFSPASPPSRLRRPAPTTNRRDSRSNAWAHTCKSVGKSSTTRVTTGSGECSAARTLPRTVPTTRPKIIEHLTASRSVFNAQVANLTGGTPLDPPGTPVRIHPSDLCPRRPGATRRRSKAAGTQCAQSHTVQLTCASSG